VKRSPISLITLKFVDFSKKPKIFEIVKHKVHPFMCLFARHLHKRFHGIASRHRSFIGNWYCITSFSHWRDLGLSVLRECFRGVLRLRVKEMNLCNLKINGRGKSGKWATCLILRMQLVSFELPGRAGGQASQACPPASSSARSPGFPLPIFPGLAPWRLDSPTS